MSDKFTSEQLDEQDRPLVEQLERMYGTQAGDAQSLARVRARIVRNSMGSLPFSRPASSSEHPAARSQKRPAKEKDMRFMHIITAREKPWQRQLNLIAAAIFIVLLVGSLVLVVVRRPQGSVAGLPPLQPGWRQIVLLSGSSSKTFAHQDIVLSTLWGMSFGCVGQGKVDIEFDGQTVNSAHTMCQLNTRPVISAPPYGPERIQLAVSEHSIQTIKVTVSGSLKWYLQFSNALVMPSPLLSVLLAPGSGWQEDFADSSRGSAGEGFTSLGFTLPDGKAFAPKVWGLVIVCSGSGKVHIQIYPPLKGVQIATPACNGQPVLDILRFPSSPVNESMQISADFFTVVWQIRILACIDEQACLKHQ